MALIVIGAAKGAPGVTATTAALAAVWPSPVILVEADPSGSDLHLLVRTEGGRPLQGGQRGAGMLGLAAHGGNRATLLAEPITQTTDLGVPLVIGPPHSRTAYAMGPAWGQAANSLAQLSREGRYDVLVDIGRVDDQSLALPLVNRADVVVLMAKRNLRGIAHTRRVAGIVEEHLRVDTATAAAAAAHLLIVDDPATSARVETQWALAAKGLKRSWSTLGTIAHDVDGAQDFFNATSPRRDVSVFTNSVRQVATELHDLARHLPAPAALPQPQVGTAAPVTADDIDARPSQTVVNAQTPTSRALASDAPVSTAQPSAVVWPPLPPSRRGTAGRGEGTDLDAQDFLEDDNQPSSGEEVTTSSAQPDSSNSAATAERGPQKRAGHEVEAREIEASGPQPPASVAEPRRGDQQLTGAGTRTR